jgi:TolB-like protein
VVLSRASAAPKNIGDGIAEDVLTDLAKLRWLFVIARNSSFTFKGKSVDVRLVGRELGVRYVLEGSIRRPGNRIRVAGQLVDATTGATFGLRATIAIWRIFLPCKTKSQRQSPRR